MQKFFRWISRISGLLMVLALILANIPLSARAAEEQVVPDDGTTNVQITTTAEGVELTWGNVASADVASAAAVAASTAALQNLPIEHFQGYDLPMQLVTLHLPEQALAEPLQVDQVYNVDWKENLQASGPLQPPALDWVDHTDLHPAAQPVLPTSPVFILRQGQIHGQRIAVVAISPLYQNKGVTKFATALRVKAAGATPIEGRMTNFLQSLPAQATNVTAAAVAPESLEPTNPAAASTAVKVVVDKVGLQTISGQALTDAGLNPATVDLSKVHLYHNGTEIPLEIVQSPGLAFQFYAASVGDRWNLNEIYWLTVEATNGLRMTTRAVTPGGATATQTAVEKGVWEQNLVYQSNQAGLDGDHWFNTQMEVAPAQQGNPATYPTATVALNNVLPLAAGTSTFTFTVSAYFRANYNLQVDLGNVTTALKWNSAPQSLLIQNWSLPLITSTNASELHLTLLPGATVQGLNLDRLFWQRPVTLNFQNKGAAFSGVDGAWLYNWQNAPTNNAQYQLYDVTNPLAPVILTGVTAAGFQDGPAAHDYLLAGPGVVQTPQTSAHAPVVFSVATGADTVYIAPKDFIAALEPLLAHRRAQGYTATAVDVQTIYDAWSFGQVSAPAIRNFLRFAKANWQPSPISVVLVGDATWDPHNYTKQNNTNFMPAYMANVDPWLGETSCENCFAQLDGDNPLTGDGQLFNADLWIGRFPVKSADELANVVKKIVHYETDPNMGAWRGQSVFLADNYITGLDANGAAQKDGAGDFAADSDAGVKLLAYPPDSNNKDASSPNCYTDGKYGTHCYDTSKPGFDAKRVYYDPYPQISDPQGVEPWRVSDPYTTWANVMSDLSAGAGLVTYNGHSHHWQWGSTDPNAAKGYLFSLYDTDLLSNADALFISLSMTCYTAQFAKPAISGTTFDERMFLNPKGGAVAVWGPAGLSVTTGHANLQHGFYSALWAAPSMKAHLGELVAAGYDDLRQHNTCCQDMLQTFLLLGDPLTPARVQPMDSIYLPLINRR
ncbi:MAG: C25 family cysteine peptidase [Chloroflexi bacterium]|nr:C25 family cysteine peptidase [Chloroflexota bacterium]